MHTDHDHCSPPPRSLRQYVLAGLILMISLVICVLSLIIAAWGYFQGEFYYRLDHKGLIILSTVMYVLNAFAVVTSIVTLLIAGTWYVLWLLARDSLRWLRAQMLAIFVMVNMWLLIFVCGLLIFVFDLVWRDGSYGWYFAWLGALLNMIFLVVAGCILFACQKQMYVSENTITRTTSNRESIVFPAGMVPQ